MKKFAKILCIVLCLAMVLSFAAMAFAAEGATATISFADPAFRTVMNDNQQVWQQNGITVTNDIGDSTQPIKDYANPVRFYAKTTLTIAYPGMTAIVVDCNTEKYANALVDAVSGAEAVAAADVVTITLPAAADSFTVALVAQVRVDEISVYAGAAPEAPITVTELNIDEHMDAAKWTFNGEKAAIENGQLNLPAIGDTAAAMLNESAQNASFKFTLTINEVPADCYDKWWDTELLFIARSSLAEKSWSDDFAQTGYTLTSWGDMTEWFIGRAGNDDLSGKIVLNIADGQPHEIEMKVVNNADNTAVTVTLIVDGEQVAEIVDDGTAIKNDRPALYPDAGNFTVRAKNMDITLGVAAPEAVEQLQFVAAPQNNVAYKLGLTQVNLNKNLYLTGEMAGYYFGLTEDINAAADVFVENVEGGFKMYILKDGVKNYIDIVASGKYNNVVFSTEDGKVFAYNEECKNLVTHLDDKELYLGTYKENSTISASYTSYINAENTCVSQFPAGLIDVGNEPIPEEPVAESKTLSIGDKVITAEGGKWLYNTEVTKETASGYTMIVFDKNYAGTFETNGYGVALVLDQYGTLVRVYDGANVGFWTAEGKAASAHFNANTYATTAWAELQDGETLIIIPNDGGSNDARKIALSMRGDCGKTAALEGFTFETAPEEPTPTEPQPTEPAPTEPVEPGAPDTGDIFGIVVALMAVSGMALVVLKKKF